MPTVKEVLNDTKKRLKEQGIDTYSLDSSLLVSEVTGLTKIQLVTHDRDEVTEEQINRLENLVKERLKNKLYFFLQQRINDKSRQRRVCLTKHNTPLLLS